MNTGADIKSGACRRKCCSSNALGAGRSRGPDASRFCCRTGCSAIPGDEYVRWWILRHCEVLASVDLPVDPFKVTLKDYSLTPALPSLLVLRRRSDEELMRTTHPDYWVFMAVVDRAGVDARGNLLFERAPDGEELVFDEDGCRTSSHRRRSPVPDRAPATAPRR